jgi:shikimate dehydrogenase
LSSLPSQLVGVMGQPIAHSLSPVLHRAAFASLSLPWQSHAFAVGPDGVDGALAAMRSLSIRGLSVTMPLKTLVAQRVDVLSDVARDLDAVNCITLLDDGQLEGHNTDGSGFVAALDATAPGSIGGRRVAVLGAGGAARAVIRAVAAAGASEVVVVNRTRASAEAGARLAGAVGRVGEGRDVANADLVVQATSIGMAAGVELGDELPCDPSLLRAGQVVAELIYHPSTTAFMAAAATNGCTVVGGLPMLVYQAVDAIERWSGLRPDAAPMLTAGAAALAAR